MEISGILNIFRRYLWLLILVILVASITTFFILSSQPTLFVAKTRLLVGPTLDSPSPDLNSLKIGGQLIQTYAELVNTRPFLDSINSKLDQKVDPAVLDRMIETLQNVDTRILTIVVKHEDSNQAVAIANAAAETLIEISPSKDNTTSLLRMQMSNQSRQVEQIITNAENSILLLESQLITLGEGREQNPAETQAALEEQNLIIQQLAEERARLSDALRTLATVYQVLLDTNTNQIEIIEPAVRAGAINQQLPIKTAMSGLAGLMLATIIVFGFNYFDDTFRLSGDFTKVAGVPLLSTIEKNTHLNGTGLARVAAFAQPRSLAANDYHTAVAKLLFTMGRSMPYTLMVSSVGSSSGDDTADAAANLAVAFAQVGNRVVLVDAQLHNPVLTELFSANSNAGLVDLFAINPPKLQLIPVKEVPGLRLLPAGLSSKMSSSTMLNSGKIARQIEELKKDADIVLVASSPISWFAESLTLASLVNGVVLVARYGDAHGKVVNDVVQNLRVMNIQLAGVIFDQNSSPLVSKQDLGNVSAVARAASKAAIFRNLKIKGQVNVDTIRPPDPADVVMPADENTELTSLNQVDIITVPTPDTDNLPMPADEIEVSSLAIVTIDVNAAQSPNLTDSITSTDEITSLEKVVIDPTQPRDLVEDAAIPADENTELPNLGQVDVDTIQSPDLADVATFVNENLELPNLDQVDVFSARSSALAPHDSTMSSEENLESALLATGVEKVKINDLKNSKDSRRVNHRKYNRP